MDEKIIGIATTAAAYIAGAAVFYRFSLNRGFSKLELSRLLFAALVGGIFGAKLTAFVLDLLHGASPGAILAHPDGRSIIGGVLFGCLGVELAKDRLKIKRSTGDGFALALSLGEAIGRLGCFFNGCCVGVASSVPWAVYQAGALRHPTQIYQALVALGIFAMLSFLKDKTKYEGDLFRIYLLCFGVSRFFMEFLRVRSEIFYGLSMAQWVGLELTIAMGAALIWTHAHAKQMQAETAKSGTKNETM